jgi:hypothetical protein
MKKKIETKQDRNEFARFEDFVRKIVRVPKDEILEREKAEKKEKAERKARKT